MLVSRSSASTLMGVAVATCSLVLGCGSPPQEAQQEAQSVSCPDGGADVTGFEDLIPELPLEDLTYCAEQGDAFAQARLGVMYDLGDGVPEDDEEAVRWYRLAAEQENAAAQNALGVMYDNGDGVPEDFVYAYMWYNLSAAQGIEVAQSNKDVLEGRMTRDQIAAAQRLSREWIETHPGDGP